MAVKIQEQIGQQGFEIVRDMIGAVLLEELENQKVLQGFEEDINVYQERTTPIQTSEQVLINVQLISSNYSGMTQKDTQGRTIYYIDIYTTGQESSDHTGDLNASLRLHKFVGMVRYILEYSEYKTLNMPLGVIAGGSVDDFFIFEPSLPQDSNFVRMGRVTVSYKIQERQAMIQGSELLGNNTTVKLNPTDLGYKYELNN